MPGKSDFGSRQVNKSPATNRTSERAVPHATSTRTRARPSTSTQRLGGEHRSLCVGPEHLQCCAALPLPADETAIPAAFAQVLAGQHTIALGPDSLGSQGRLSRIRGSTCLLEPKRAPDATVRVAPRAGRGIGPFASSIGCSPATFDALPRRSGARHRPGTPRAQIGERTGDAG
jgi:hypothetical protein